MSQVTTNFKPIAVPVEPPAGGKFHDAAVFAALDDELRRQQRQIELIASENIVSDAVLAAQGSVLTNKYAEGYPGRRYYGGCEHVDQIEAIAIARAKQLFGCGFANVQPHSVAGLVAGGVYPSPVPHAHVVTTTTHKTLRGPRGGLILTNDPALAKLIDAAVFPGVQGGPLMHVIAAKAVALGEAQRPEFRAYAQQTVANARTLAETLLDAGFDIVSGGTDSHLVLVDLRPKGLTGNVAERALEHCGLTCNKNGIPFDPQKPAITSGIRLGTPAGTTRGFGEDEFRTVGRLIIDVLDSVAANGTRADPSIEARVRGEVIQLCERFPIYGRLTDGASATMERA